MKCLRLVFITMVILLAIKVDAKIESITSFVNIELLSTEQSVISALGKPIEVIDKKNKHYLVYTDKHSNISLTPLLGPLINKKER